MNNAQMPKAARRHGVVHAHTSEPASWPNVAQARRKLRTAAQESPGKGIHRDVHTTGAHQRFLCGSSSRAGVAEQSPAAHSVASHHWPWSTALAYIPQPAKPSSLPTLQATVSICQRSFTKNISHCSNIKTVPHGVRSCSSGVHGCACPVRARTSRSMSCRRVCLRFN